jgi:hypothetical protein
MLRVVLRPAGRGGRWFRRKVRPEVLGEVRLGPEFFAVLARAPDGWTRTLDALPAPGADEVVFGRLEARMAATELSRISPYAESAAEQASFAEFRALVDTCAAAEDRELALSPL